MMHRAGRVLTMFAVFALIALRASVAGATSITVGQLFFDVDVPESVPGAADGTNAFFVNSLSGTDSFPPDLPLTDALVLTSLQLVLDDGSTTSTYFLNDSSPGTPGTLFGLLQSATYVSATLTGSFQVKPYGFNDGTNAGVFVPTSAMFHAAIAQPTGLVAGDSAEIRIDGEIRPLDTNPEPVPEPATLILVGTGVATALRRRMKRRGAANSF